MIDFEIYNQEIIRFLNSVTIKFDPFMNQMNEMYKDKLNIDTNVDSTMDDELIQSKIKNWPYLLNITGNYHGLNTKAYIKNNVLISKSNLDINNNIRSYYQNNYNELQKLYFQYPNSIEIIKTSIFPTTYSILEIYKLPNLSILSYYENYLNNNEKEDIITYLRIFIDYIIDRWYVDSFHQEELYPHIWWGTFWLLLYVSISTKRILNIKTEYAHDLHIVEYLLSKGFKQCNNFFNSYIKKFLYKNYYYLYKHRGKNSILELLDNHILQPLGYNLKKYTIKKHTYLRKNTKDWEPEIIVTDKNDNQITDINFTINELLFKLNNQELIPYYDQDHNNYVYNKVKYNKWNTLLTKYFSLSQETLNMFYDQFLYPLVFDCVIDLINKNKIELNYSLDDKISIINSDITIGDVTILEMIYLYTYSLLKYTSNENVDSYQLPQSYKTLTLKNKEDINFDNWFRIGNSLQQIDCYVPVNKLIERIYKTNELLPITSQEELYQYLQIVINTIIEATITLRNCGSLNYNFALISTLIQIFEQKVISIPLYKEGITTFSEYFDIRSDLKALLNTFDKIDFLNFAINILFFMVKIDSSFSNYISSPELQTNINCLLNILNRFNSYNINYTTEHFTEKYIFTYPLFRTGTMKTTNESIIPTMSEHGINLLSHYNIMYNDKIKSILKLKVYNYGYKINTKIDGSSYNMILKNIINESNVRVDTGVEIKIS